MAKEIKQKNHRRCTVGPCDNDERYPAEIKVMPHVDRSSFTWHKFPRDKLKCEKWVTAVSKGRKGFERGTNTFVCSNHFIDGNPKNGPPSLYLTLSHRSYDKTPTRAPPRSREMSFSSNSDEDVRLNNTRLDSTEDCPILHKEYVPMYFCHITREYDVRFFTGIPGPDMFHMLFQILLEPKGKHMNYWLGPKLNASREIKEDIQGRKMAAIFSDHSCTTSKPGPARKLTLEQEFLMVMMRLRLDLLVNDLAFRFKVSNSRVTQVLITWVRFLSKQLGWLIIWPSRGQVYRTLPSSFKRLYPDTRCIIDCSEVFIERPSSLQAQSECWSDYKNHCTFKFLVSITPNGAVSWISPAYGGRASDIFIVRDSGFLKQLEPHDRIMADRGFKMKTDLAMHQCYLSIPPSAAKGTQLTSADVRTTSKIANVRIFVEQAIKRMKEFRILKGELSLLELPLVDDYLIICAAICNLSPPLTE